MTDNPKSKQLKVGEDYWFLDDHLLIHKRTVISINDSDKSDDVAEVHWEGDKERDWYFRPKTYVDKSLLLSDLKETGFPALKDAQERALEGLREDRKRLARELASIDIRIDELSRELT